jgi:hypothetical protein
MRIQARSQDFKSTRAVPGYAHAWLRACAYQSKCMEKANPIASCNESLLHAEQKMSELDIARRQLMTVSVHVTYYFLRPHLVNHILMLE